MRVDSLPKLLAHSFFGLPGLKPVTNLASAVAAIEGIVEQGEGASGDNEDSHYGRFKAMGEQYDQMLKEDPSFVPGRPVVSNPYSILPQDVGNLSSVNLLEDRLSVPISNLFDGFYELVMQIISRFMMHTEESEAQIALLASISIDLMTDVIGPLGEVLTLLPAGESNPGMNAGPSFRFTRDGTAAPHQISAWKLFVERMDDMSAYCGILEMQGSSIPALTGVKASLARYAKQLSDASSASS